MHNAKEKMNSVMLAVGVLCLTLSGCASITYRTQTHRPVRSGMFPSVRSDVQMLSDLRTKNYDSLMMGLEPLVFVLSAGDIPFAIIVDCLALPFDLHKDRIHARKFDALMETYLPRYRATESDDAGKDYAASYSLLSDMDEKIALSWDAPDELYALLVRNNIKIAKGEEAIDLDVLIDMLLYGHVLNPKLERRAYYEDGSWHVVINRKAKETPSGWLGRDFALDEHGVLQKIRRSSSR